MISCMCIAVDVKDSRRLNKEQLRISLINCCNEINAAFERDIIVPFDVRNGDELLGVIDHLAAGYNASQMIEEKLSSENIYLYIGLGIGTLDTIDSTIHTMNGSAVLNAFEARDRFLKKVHPEAKPWLSGEEASTTFFYINGYPYQSLNALHFAICEKKVGRSDKQKEVLTLMESHPEATYEQIGQILGYKSPKSTVSYLLTRAHYQTVLAMENSLIQLLNYLENDCLKEDV
ncbi:SatD family protein [Pseudalkalibacillus berkeleyi]|uniref:SatD family protein n=1 Tax=Pseudalkalibacillus berkeleyi TaxID=1069813 RepID=A0ABS9H162_9BACL|nr:SatD family protein [Pseudalkalibacillus berkeleyi]MCF6137395.1 SatD family protein [Pseudalkalibacillus berkeleyi]